MEFKLLVIDDEPAVTAALAELFRDRGYQVLRAGSGDEAVSIVDREPVDLMILDLHMPGFSGEDVLRHVKTTVPKTKVVIVTGYADREPGARALGCDGFLTKPLAIAQLTHLVDTLLTQKDEEELKAITMGTKLLDAAPGDPLADLLLVEPSDPLARILVGFLGNPREARGTYTLELATNLPQALAALLTVHPDLVLLNVLSVGHPAEAVRALLACEVQPKEYIFYMRPRALEDLQVLEAVPAKRWEGNPWRTEDLKRLAQLVRQTALGHGLVKR